jgi:hypothetical protein
MDGCAVPNGLFGNVPGQTPAIADAHDKYVAVL